MSVCLQVLAKLLMHAILLTSLAQVAPLQVALLLARLPSQQQLQ
jgi:hypothetical protein